MQPDLLDMMFAGAGPASSPQQFIFTANTTFTVPAGVFQLSALAQQTDGNSAAVTVTANGTMVLRAQNGARIGDGGGDGGLPGTPAGSFPQSTQAGGGGGGYTGAGGKGGTSGEFGSTSGTAGSNGQGGGGGGGGGGHWPGNEYVDLPAERGGHVGCKGIGANGLGGAPAATNFQNPNTSTPASPGGDGSGDQDLGNIGGAPRGVQGGALAWVAAIPVNPGQVLTINAAGGRVRIISGPGRSYPYNAASVFTLGESYRYWRVVFQGYQAGSSYVALYEIELRATAGGADVTTPATAITANSTFSSSFPASNAVDNNATTYWASASLSPQPALTLDLGTAQPIRQWALRPRDNGASTRSPVKFTVYASFDGVDWAAAKVFDGQTGWSDGVQRLFDL
ncbi:discoidin domain-containing protein [Acidovorax sp. FG27]|uniref:discoidin domain-containing protein n=1 Tax=Acidovorax sp. FG27 TaxID=3133652 RepID=UPI0030E9C2CA